MFLILLSLFLGMILGFFLKSKKLRKVVDKGYYISVLALLFLMGIGIGQNKEICSNIGKIGLLSFSLAVISIAGSIIFVKLIDKTILKIETKRATK